MRASAAGGSPPRVPVLCGLLAVAASGLLGPGAAAQGAQVLWQRHGDERNSRFTHGFAPLGDVDGDGVRDLAVSQRRLDRGEIFILSGRDGTILRRLVSGLPTSRPLGAAGDLDGDGMDDLMVFHGEVIPGPQRVDIVSGADGRTLLQIRDPSNGRWMGLSSPFDGFTMASLGDVDGDGVRDFVLGSSQSSIHENDHYRGHVTIFSGRTGRPLRVIRPVENDMPFGWAVAAAGDLDGDGVEDLVVGAHGTCRVPSVRNCPPMDLAAGSVSAFCGATGRRLWRVVGLDGEDLFGHAVASIGDVDGDGVPDVVAGAPINDISFVRPPRPGYAKVLSGRTGQVLAVLRGCPSEPGDYFGGRVAGVGDINGDGVPDIAVAAVVATSRNGQIRHAGRVCVFSGRDFSLLHVVEGDVSGGGFGQNLLGMGDVNGDDFGDFLVARWSDDGFSSRGGVFVFSGAPPGVSGLGRPCVPEGDESPPRIGMTGAPVVGRSLEVHLTGVAPGATAILLLGASDSDWLGTPLPLDLTSSGLAGCSLWISPDVLLPQPVGAGGIATRTLAVPSDPSLAGSTFYTKWCVVDPASQGAPLTLTRALRCRVLPP